jgi:hypothetical protein
MCPRADTLAWPDGPAVDDVSVFRLNPETVAWLAGTFDLGTPQRALLKALALSADANLAGRVADAAGDGESLVLHDLLTDDDVAAIVASAMSAHPDLPIPLRAGPAQQLAIDEVIRRGVQRPEADVTWLP